PRPFGLIVCPSAVAAWPPAPRPVQGAAGVAPARARPVPFGRHGFERPPATRPRLLTARVPARSALSSARTASWTRWGFTSAPRIRSSSIRSFDVLPSPSRTGALRRRLGDAAWRSAGLCPVDRFVPVSDLGAATLRLLPHLDQTIFRTGNGALDEQEVLLGVDRVDGQADLRDALAAQPAGHLDPFEDPRRRRGRADRARLADVVRAMRGRAAPEVVALDRPGEPLADRDARDLDAVTGLESLDGHGLALGSPRQPAKLQQVAVRRDAVLAEVAKPRLREPLLRDLLEGDLHRVVAVDSGLLDGDDRARPRLDHGH